MTPVPRGMLGLCLLLAFAVIAPTAKAAAYLFVPGHGLTDTTVGNKPGTNPSRPYTVPELIDLCRYTTGPNTGTIMPWMKIIERSYQWNELEPSVNNYSGIASRIIADAKACYQSTPKMYLRVRINHKFTTFPNASWGSGGILKLDTDAGLDHLEDLYTKVIEQLTLPANKNDALKAFYGFVLQETAIPISSEPGAYWNAASEQAYLSRLMEFHIWLSDELKNIDVGADPAGRLFWQMINTPVKPQYAIDDVVIVNNLPQGAGICGPDTAPLEPSTGGKSVYRCYNIFRTLRGVVPTSLHVYEANYHWDRPIAGGYGPQNQPGGPQEGIQPIFHAWDLDGSHNPEDSISDGVAGEPYHPLNNGFGGLGLANFLGCVKDVAPNATPAGYMPRDSLRLNNIIWSCKDSTLGGVPYGWPQVRAWMESKPSNTVNPNNTNANKVFPGGTAGGCNTTLPTNSSWLAGFAGTDEDPNTPEVTIARLPVAPPGAAQ